MITSGLEGGQGPRGTQQTAGSLQGTNMLGEGAGLMESPATSHGLTQDTQPRAAWGPAAGGAGRQDSGG